MKTTTYNLLGHSVSLDSQRVLPRIFLFLLICGLVCIVSHSAALAGGGSRVLGLDPYLTFAGNFDVGYHRTQFFEQNHDVSVGIWDSRVELWLPPFRHSFSWGPYFRIAGIAASRDPAWENAWLSKPGLGFQAYPFSFPTFRQENSVLGGIFGPLRLFGEYNWQNYWGSENSWRPDHQIRAGAEYWREFHVNQTDEPWWGEIWGGLYWQSANEFDPHFDTLIFATALRSGLRLTDNGLLSAFTPYALIESSLTDNQTYYWENRLSVGGGLRFAPKLSNKVPWLNRFILYAEYVYAAAYYHQSAPSSVPDHDIRAGLSFSFGEWYHRSERVITNSNPDSHSGS